MVLNIQPVISYRPFNVHIDACFSKLEKQDILQGTSSTLYCDQNKRNTKFLV